MFETLGFETITPRQASVVLGLGLGLLFGALALVTRFCFRRAVVGADRKQAAGVWLTALAVAVLGTQLAVFQGWISFEEHRFLSSELPLTAIVLGGLLFGAGMVLTRGCISRLTVLSGTGNLRAVLCVLVFAFVAHASMKGVLAPLVTQLRSQTLELPSAALPGAPYLWTALIALAALLFAVRSGNRTGALLGAALIGLLVPLGWVGTGYVLFDEFDPIAMQSLAFTAPTADGLFYVIAATSIPAGFGAGLIGGVLLGSTLLALALGQFQWQSFTSPSQTGRYMTGAALMGLGGVLAGGCTVGAGLAGLTTLSLAAVIALASIAAGGLLTDRLLNAASSGFGGSPAIPSPPPAE